MRRNSINPCSLLFFAQSFRLLPIETSLDCTNATEFTHYSYYSYFSTVANSPVGFSSFLVTHHKCGAPVAPRRGCGSDGSGEARISLDRGPLVECEQLKDVVRPEQPASQKFN